MSDDQDVTRPSLLPPNKSAIEAGLDLGFAKLLERIVPPFPELMNPRETPVEFLPYLAADRGVSEWKTSAPEEEKRLTVELAWPTKRQAGTHKALENAIKGLQLIPEVTPWYLQTPLGDPYSFKVRAFAPETYSEEMNDRLDRRLADAKSERDTMSVTIGLSATGIHYIGAATLCAEVTTIYPFVLEGLEVSSALYVGAGTFTTETTTIYPLEL
jgi:phage tail P2-like protein